MNVVPAQHGKIAYQPLPSNQLYKGSISGLHRSNLFSSLEVIRIGACLSVCGATRTTKGRTTVDVHIEFKALFIRKGAYTIQLQ